MGRSVMTYGEKQLYFTVDLDSELDYEFTVESISDALQTAGLYTGNGCVRFTGREGVVIAEEYGLFYVVVTEYCGACALNFVPWDEHNARFQDYPYAIGLWRRNLERSIARVSRELDWVNQLVKVGTFSNGVSIYEHNA